MESSVKYQSSMPDTFKISQNHSGPSDESCAVQLTVVHPLKDSEANYEKHQNNLSLQMLRKWDGLAAPLKLTMEMNATRKMGRLPFLQSSMASFDSLTGKDETIDFSDFLGTPEFSGISRQPHVVMEKTMGIF